MPLRGGSSDLSFHVLDSISKFLHGLRALEEEPNLNHLFFLGESGKVLDQSPKSMNVVDD